ncbi:MAG: hypothetical protein KL863_22250 [Rhizobium sp.]|nr:hypothetical protein [Rhizobium sp.]
MEHWTDTRSPIPAEDKARDPATLSFIERISWFERQSPMTADNDNAGARAEEDSACFQSWAMPDYLRK